MPSLMEDRTVAAYDPKAQYEIKVWDVEFRKNPSRTLMARIHGDASRVCEPA